MEFITVALAGAMLGGIFMFLMNRFFAVRQQKVKSAHEASLLYYDLKSIENYLKEENTTVNLRYSMQWQNMVADCSFLKDSSVRRLYEIYTEVYNYNCYYSMTQQTGKVNKQDNPHYHVLRKLFFGADAEKDGAVSDVDYEAEYETLLEELEQKQQAKTARGLKKVEQNILVAAASVACPLALGMLCMAQTSAKSGFLLGIYLFCVTSAFTLHKWLYQREEDGKIRTPLLSGYTNIMRRFELSPFAAGAVFYAVCTFVILGTGNGIGIDVSNLLCSVMMVVYVLGMIWKRIQGDVRQMIQERRAGRTDYGAGSKSPFSFAAGQGR